MLRTIKTFAVICGLFVALGTPGQAQESTAENSEAARQNNPASAGISSGAEPTSPNDSDESRGVGHFSKAEQSDGDGPAQEAAEAEPELESAAELDSESGLESATELDSINEARELAGCPPCPECPTCSAEELLEEEAEDEDVDDPEVVWSGSLGAGLLALAGNTSSLTTSANAGVERRSKRWILALKANGTYGESHAVDDSAQILAQAASLLLRSDFRFTPRFSYYLAAGADTDRVKSVEWRGTGETGLGYIVLDRRIDKRELLFLRTDLAFRYQYESRFQYFPTRENLEDVELRAPRVALTFRSSPTGNFGFLQELELLPNIGDIRFLVNSLTKLSVALIERLSLTTSLLVQYDSAPAAGRVPTDLTLTVGLEVPFG